MALGEMRSALGGAVKTRTLEAGELLFRQGDATFAMFSVESGRLRLLRHTACGGQVTIHVARPGESLAEPSLFSPAYHCDCVADTRSIVAVFPKQALMRAMADDPDLALRMMARLAGLVQTLRSRIEYRNVRSAKDRALRALMLAEPPGGGPFEIDGALKTLASEIGLTHEALYRALRDLEAEGRILRAGKAFTVLRHDV
ncbi:MAG: Crp/Fnr family transcriptional regulator [Alphaproteobacteria bacterium]|nr:Crp/Fnr family transcriptional regulator [Alphaproteobacteria bacterium]